jgi:capsid protein
MPWIDPAKEATANETLERALHKSAPEIIRARGANPREVLAQQANWLRAKKAAGLVEEPKPAPAPPADAGADDAAAEQTKRDDA